MPSVERNGMQKRGDGEEELIEHMVRVHKSMIE